MEAILWHRACEILRLRNDERLKGWHDELNIEQIVQLHYPNDEAMQKAFLSLMKMVILEGKLDVSGANTRFSPAG